MTSCLLECAAHIAQHARMSGACALSEADKIMTVACAALSIGQPAVVEHAASVLAPVLGHLGVAHAVAPSARGVLVSRFLEALSWLADHPQARSATTGAGDDGGDPHARALRHVLRVMLVLISDEGIKGALLTKGRGYLPALAALAVADGAAPQPGEVGRRGRGGSVVHASGRLRAPARLCVCVCVCVCACVCV